MSLKIFLTGATGLIGGSVLTRLLRHPDSQSFAITVLVRTEDNAVKLGKVGVKTIVGSYDDDDLTFLTNAAAEADVVIETAQSHSPPPALAILKGIKRRYGETGKAPILIHDTITGFILDDARGLTSEHRTYSDLYDTEKFDTLPINIQKSIDNTMIKADEEGYVKTYLLAPTMVFGNTSGIVSDTGVQRLRSGSQIPAASRVAIARKAAGFFGNGLNFWAYVHVDDVADFHIVLLDVLLSPNPERTGHGKEGYYFLETGYIQQTDIAKAIGEELFRAGAIPSPKPVPYTEDDLTKFFGPWWVAFAANCYAKGDRARELGWKPRTPKETRISVFENIKVEVAHALSS